MAFETVVVCTVNLQTEIKMKKQNALWIFYRFHINVDIKLSRFLFIQWIEQVHF